MKSHGSSINVCIFCGGRGSATLIRALLRRPEVSLSLLVNAYDDGLSTGALRNFIPGMLGPSDFRKNLSYLLDLYSAEQYALQKLFEYRLPMDFSASDLAALRKTVETGDTSGLKAPLSEFINDLDAKAKARTLALLGHFFRYYDKRVKEMPFEFVDCSVGNLIFAGAYLEQGNDFNEAARILAELAGSSARLINVSKGEGRTLVGLKVDGELLESEAVIVGPQSSVPISDLFFLGGVPDPAAWAKVANGTLEEKRAWLRSQELVVEPSTAAIQALAQADIVIYGPGTQHSSLLPSYRIAHEAILSSPAPIKAFVANLREDHDIQCTSAVDLVDKALHLLGDEENKRRGITHIIYNGPSATWADGITLGNPVSIAEGDHRGAVIVQDDFANPSKPTVHGGLTIINRIIELAERGAIEKQDLDIYVDLAGRSLGVDGVLQDLMEIRWASHFRSVSMTVNQAPVPAIKGLPPFLSAKSDSRDQIFPDIDVLRDWLLNGKSEYLATLTGDGEYQLSDIILGMRLLDGSRFGALYGSRTQSRRQFHTSLRAAYGEGGVLLRLSWFGAFLLTALLGMRTGIIFSDPLTGFRLYRRSRLSPGLVKILQQKLPNTPVEVTKLLVKNEIEIAEMPVSYRTFTGFTRPKWRFKRGLKNLFGVLS